jgi:hypothetical protein
MISSLGGLNSLVKSHTKKLIQTGEGIKVFIWFWAIEMYLHIHHIIAQHYSVFAGIPYQNISIYSGVIYWFERKLFSH